MFLSPRALLIFSLIIWKSSAFGQGTTDPLPEELPSDGVGVTLEQFVRIPSSPNAGSNDPRDPDGRIRSSPRLNMLKESPDGTGRLFVIDQHGFLYVVSADKQVGLYLSLWDTLNDDFIYLGGQTGTTSFAFHPDFISNGKLYTVHSSPLGSGDPDFFAKRPINPGDGEREPFMHDVVVEWTATDPSANEFSGTRREIMRIEQPYGDHNLGEIAFNPNSRKGDADYGLLYLAVADGGNMFPIADADPENNGQDTTTILGTICRIDPLGDNSANGQYGIPVDNPFVDTTDGTLPEIWAYGLRNPHRISWDTRGDRSMYAFDIGQALIEEVNRIVPGGNYGWGDREGSFLLEENTENILFPLPENETEGTFEYPVLQYDHPQSSSDGSAIAGGFVYRGFTVPDLYGKLVFADFTSSGDAYYAHVSDIEKLAWAESAPIYLLDVYNSNGLASLSRATVGSFDSRTDARIGMDLQGEIYFMNKRNGWVHKMTAQPNGGPVWPIVFPEATVFDDDFIFDESFGDALYVAEFPWIYAYNLGWAFISVEGSVDGGIWTYIPR